MAKSLNCEKGPTAAPCMECTSCIEVKQVNSPSVIEIDAASHNSVDDARILIERAPLVSVGGQFKIYIIDECHMLTKEAFNALLKTIEEPPPNVIFILATTEEHKVPPTIISRCQRLMFKLINHDELAAYLRVVATKENINIDDPAIQLIARRSGGGLRDALGLLDQASLLATPEKAVALDDLLLLLGSVREDLLLRISKAIHEGDAQPVLMEASSLLAEGREPALIALELAKHFLNLAKAAFQNTSGKAADGVSAPVILGSPSYLEALAEQTKLFDRTELAQMIEQLDRLEQSCRRSTQSALTLEIGLLSLCHRLEITELKQLKSKVAQLEAALAGGATLPAVAQQRPAAPRPQAAPQTPSHAPAPSRPAAPSPHPPSQAPAQAAPSHTPAQAPAARDSQSDSEENSASNSEPMAPLPVAATNDYDDAEPESEVVPQQTDFTEIEEVWSAILDDLHERHKPTYSLLSSHGTPMTLTRDELIIGVKEVFQKMLEAKMDHIKAACLQGAKRDIFIRIKPVAQVPENKPRASNVGAGNSPGKTERTSQPAEPANISAQMKAPDKQRLSPSPDAQTNTNGHGPVKTSQSSLPEPTEKNALVKDAYRIFEGPGSRQFGEH